MWHACEGGGKCTGFGGKARRKETTCKTKADERKEDEIRMDLREIGWGCGVD
jgi:hypothetical protein